MKTELERSNGSQLTERIPAVPSTPRLPTTNEQQALAITTDIIDQLQRNAISPDQWAGVVAHLGGGAEYVEVIRIVRES